MRNSKLNGNSSERVHQLAEPFDLNRIKNSLAEAISEVVSKHLGSSNLTSPPCFPP